MRCPWKLLPCSALPVAMLLWLLGSVPLRAADPSAPPADPPGPPMKRLLEGQANFRDLGGYRTEDGRRTRTGRVFRSGELAHLSDEDVAQLEKLNVRRVVSFLTPHEQQVAGKDRLPPGAKLLSLPIPVEGDLARVATEAQRTGDFSHLPPETSQKVHRQLPGEARSQYARLLRQLARGESGALVFHCSHGVHRTGTATAVLLWALGVPWETIREDYLLSNRYRQHEIDRSLSTLRDRAAREQGIPAQQVDMANMRAFLVLKGTYIDGTRDAILKDYGSVNGYLTEGLGLTEAEIAALRENLLE